MINSGIRARANIHGILLSILIVVAGGILISLVATLISFYVYVIFFFPLGMGYAAAKIIQKTIITNKIRIPFWSIVLGVLAGFVIFGTFHYGDYLLFRFYTTYTLNQESLAEFGRSDSSVSNRMIDYFLEDETGHPAFVGYILWRAKVGISASHFFGGSYSNIGTSFTWVYWLFELVFIGLPGISMGYEAASKPFCDVHNRWYDGMRHVGGADISGT